MYSTILHFLKMRISQLLIKCFCGYLQRIHHLSTQYRSLLKNFTQLQREKQPVFWELYTCHLLRQILLLLDSVFLVLLFDLQRERTVKTAQAHSSFIQFSHSVVSDSLWLHETQHARPPCPSLTPGVYPKSCPLVCYLTISSSVVPFSSSPQSCPASGSFQMSQLFASGIQSIGVSASTSVLPVNTQDWSSLGWTGWISLQSKGLSRVFSNTTVQKHQFFGAQFSLQSNSHIHTWPLGKTRALTRWTFFGKIMSLCINMLSRLVITFLPRSKCLLISWLKSPSAVILEPKNIKSATVSTVSPSICLICIRLFKK